MPASITRVGKCTAVVDPQTDGRQRLVEAVNVLLRDGRADHRRKPGRGRQRPGAV